MVLLTLLFGVSFVFLMGFLMAVVAAPPMIEDSTEIRDTEDEL